MGDGGLRPTYDVRLASTRAQQVIVSVDVSNVSSDVAQMAPMVEQVLAKAPAAHRRSSGWSRRRVPRARAD
jgi:hypothetical protein